MFRNVCEVWDWILHGCQLLLFSYRSGSQEPADLTVSGDCIYLGDSGGVGGKMAAPDGAGQTQLEGKCTDLGVLILEFPGLLSGAGLWAWTWALRLLQPFFPESLHAWCVRSHLMPGFPPHCTSKLVFRWGGWAECGGEAPHPYPLCRLICSSPSPQRWGWGRQLWAPSQSLLRLGPPLFP